MRREYLPRLVDGQIHALLKELPALLIEGPRATGKTTTAARHAKTIVRLDRPDEARAFEAAPDAALRELVEPVLLDEWQVVPSVLGAVKRAVDEDWRPGRFIITGSARGRLDQPTWPGTGRLVHVSMFGLTIRETLKSDLQTPSFLDRIIAHGATGLRVPETAPDLRDYLSLAIRGGFPEPTLNLSTSTRRSWMQSYVDQLLTRDIEQIEGSRDPEKLGRYFEACALNTAGVVSEKTLIDAAQINRKTAESYDQLLRNLLVIEALPAWSTNRLKRLLKAPKRYFVEPSLVAGTLELDVDGLMRDGDLLGRMLDTFVTAQLRAELHANPARAKMYHLRQEGGAHEVDLIVEISKNRVVGIEIKADSAPSKADAKHLLWLRDELGDRFIAGVVLHTGPRVFMLDERIIAAPICTLWS